MRHLAGCLGVLVALAVSNLPARSPSNPPAAPVAPAAPAVIALTGTVTAADKGTYQEHAFDVPAGVSRLDVDFTYEGRGKGTELEIGLFDPQRFRGTSRFSKDRFHLSAAEATPSYVPGPLVAGRWRLTLGIPSIPAGASSSWRATIRLTSTAAPAVGFAAGDGVLDPTARWYVGDLHAHTLHSDGFGCEDAPGAAARRGCQPWEVVEAARARGLDFLAITDHNTTSHHADLATLQATLDTLLLLRGQELTTFHGHANVYGTSAAIDFRLGFHNRSMRDVVDDVTGQGALLSINHPGRETGDRCTGCGWDAPKTPWARIEAMEIVNGGVVEGRAAGLPFWYARLNEGYRITGIGGSDDHGARSARGRLGAPATAVYAAALSEAALLEGMRSGRVHVRTRGPEGPTLDMAATAAGRVTLMGGVMDPAATGRPATLEIHVGRAWGQRLEIVRNGRIEATLEIASDDATLSHPVTLAAGQWVHARVRDERGITVIGNPIYAGSGKD